MARIIADDVKAVLETSLGNEEILIYINTANNLVTTHLGDSGLGATSLKDIERYLAAHLIATTRERMSKAAKLGDASVTYLGEFGKGLDSTPYGQMVKTLDTTGTLGNLGKKSIRMRAIKSFDS